MRVRSSLGVLAVTLVAAVACGGSGGGDSVTTSSPGPSAETGTTPVESTSPSTAGLSTTVPATSPSPPTTRSSESSTTASSEPPPVVPTTLGAPDVALLPAAPPERIDWSTVGQGWLLIDHPIGYGQPFTDPATLDQRGLYLVALDDTVYAVSALPTDGTAIAAVSDDGRLALMELNDSACAEGCTCPLDASITAHMFGYELLDLPTTAVRPVIDPVPLSVCGPGVFRRAVDLTRDGRGIWVSETWFTDDQHAATRVRLSRVDHASGSWATILDEAVVADETAPPTSWWISLVELDDGRIVTWSPAGAWLRQPDGTPASELDGPDTACELREVWDADHVVAQCRVTPEVWSNWGSEPDGGCLASGLWLVALDGSPSAPLAVPVDDNGQPVCWLGYARVAPIDDVMAIQVAGDGCSDRVVFLSATGDVTEWESGIEDLCTEQLLGVRNGSWLLSASPEGRPAVVFEVTGDGSTMVDLPVGQIIPL